MLSKKYPFLGNQPTPNTINPMDIPVGQYTEYSYYGVKFKVPWIGLVKQLDRPGIGIQLSFRESKFVTVYDGDYLFNAYTADDVARVTPKIMAFFGNDVVNDKYKLYKTIFENTPDKIKASASDKESAARLALISIKAVISGKAGTNKPVYSFTRENLKGFQIGSGNGANGEPAVLYIFDSQNKLYNFSISGTQGEIEYVIASIQFNK